jgi:hypothetical protein
MSTLLVGHDLTWHFFSSDAITVLLIGYKRETETYTCSDDQSDRRTCYRTCSASNARRLAYRRSNIVSWVPSAVDRREEDCMPRTVFGAWLILSLVPHSVLPNDSLSSVCPSVGPLGRWRVRAHRDRSLQTPDQKRRL